MTFLLHLFMRSSVVTIYSCLQNYHAEFCENEGLKFDTLKSINKMKN